MAPMVSSNGSTPSSRKSISPTHSIQKHIIRASHQAPRRRSPRINTQPVPPPPQTTYVEISDSDSKQAHSSLPVAKIELPSLLEAPPRAPTTFPSHSSPSSRASMVKTEPPSPPSPSRILVADPVSDRFTFTPPPRVSSVLPTPPRVSTNSLSMVPFTITASSILDKIDHLAGKISLTQNSLDNLTSLVVQQNHHIDGLINNQAIIQNNVSGFQSCFHRQIGTLQHKLNDILSILAITHKCATKAIPLTLEEKARVQVIVDRLILNAAKP